MGAAVGMLLLAAVSVLFCAAVGLLLRAAVGLLLKEMCAPCALGASSASVGPWLRLRNVDRSLRHHKSRASLRRIRRRSRRAHAMLMPDPCIRRVVDVTRR